MGKKYIVEDLERAVSAVKDGGISIREAERVYSVPFDTIRRRVNGSVDMDCRRLGPKPELGVELEKELYEAVIELQKIGHGIRRKEILRPAGDIGSKSKTKVFKHDMLSQRWFEKFIMRHNLSLRHPENLSIAHPQIVMY
jgi:hypothetical protein